MMKKLIAAAAATLLLAGMAHAADKFTVQLKWVPQAQFAGYYVAAAKGYYKDEGLDSGAGGRIQTLPCVRAFAPPGRRLSIGSTENGSGSYSMTIFSMASAAVSSSMAATARIGSPWYIGSMVKPRSVSVLALMPSPSDAPATGDGRSSTVMMALTPGIFNASLVSMLKTRACGMGLRSSFAHSMPSARKSSAYFALPVTFATRSGVV